MSRHSEHGNVIFIVLIAIALFGALSFAVSQGFSGANTSRISKQQAKAAAAAIIKYGSDMQSAVSRMQLVNNCADLEISFERAPFDGSDTDYINPNAPGDFSCHVFHSNGGAMPHQPPIEDHLDGVNTADGDYGDLVFGHACVNEVGKSFDGTNCNDGPDDTEFTDILFFYPFIKQEICEAINASQGYNGAIPLDVGSIFTASSRVDGSMVAGGIRAGDVVPSPNDGKFYFCLEGDINPSAGYHYYHVMVAR